MVLKSGQQLQAYIRRFGTWIESRALGRIETASNISYIHIVG